MEKQKKKYVLTVSEYFPKTHKRSGQETGFINAIAEFKKIHTIRGNYELWKKRIDLINEGKAVLSVRVWTGKPYNSTQREVFVFEKAGIEKILFDDYLYSCLIENKRFYVDSAMIPENDGLTMNDFEDWFKKHDFTKELAIIHFTNFKYSN